MIGDDHKAELDEQRDGDTLVVGQQASSRTPVADARLSPREWWRRHLWFSRAMLAVAAGLAWAMAAPPRGWWVLFPLSIAALAVGLRGTGWRTRAWLGALTGLVYYGLTLTWVTDFNSAGYVALALLETVLLAVAVALVPAGRSRRFGGWWALPAALVILQAVQERLPFGGFPLAAFAHGQVDGPFLAAAPLGGSLLVTAAAASSGVALAAIVSEHGRRRVLLPGVAIAVAVVPVLVGAAVTTREVGTMDAAIVQGGGPRGLRAIDTDPMLTTDRHLAVAENIQGSPDLVLLPENVVDVDGSIAGSEIDEWFAHLARDLDTNVVVGVTESQRAGFRNAAVLWDPDGQRIDRYEKEHRVPFGEYIPVRGLIERLSGDTKFVPRDAIVGHGTAMLDASGVPLGVAISYEVFFADRVAEGVRAGGQVVLVPTNAASFVGEEVPATELAAARLRAREFGRTVLQAAPTGYSAVVHANGDVVAVSDLGDEALLRENVPLRTGLTPYARVGDAPIALLAVALLAGAWIRNRRH